MLCVGWVRVGQYWAISFAETYIIQGVNRKRENKGESLKLCGYLKYACKAVKSSSCTNFIYGDEPYVPTLTFYD